MNELEDAIEICSVCKTIADFEDYETELGVFNECINYGAKPARIIFLNTSNIIIEECEQIFDGTNWSK